MQAKEQKICSFTQNGTRLQLIKIISNATLNLSGGEWTYPKEKFQVRLNRKIVSSSISEYNERKVFATYAQNIVLQLKIY